jgi:hypothetical protein
MRPAPWTKEWSVNTANWVVLDANRHAICGGLIESEADDLLELRNSHDRLKAVEKAAIAAEKELSRLTHCKGLISPISFQIHDKLHEALKARKEEK